MRHRKATARGIRRIYRHSKRAAVPHTAILRSRRVSAFTGVEQATSRPARRLFLGPWWERRARLLAPARRIRRVCRQRGWGGGSSTRRFAMCGSTRSSLRTSSNLASVPATSICERCDNAAAIAAFREAVRRDSKNGRRSQGERLPLRQLTRTVARRFLSEPGGMTGERLLALA